MRRCRYFVLSGCLLLILCLAGSGCRPPESRYWRPRHDRPRPLAKPRIELAWNESLPFCPDELQTRSGVLRLHLDGRPTLWLDTTGTAAEQPAIEEQRQEGPDPIAAIQAALARHYDEPPEHTAWVSWRHLVMVAVPEARTVHAIDLRKKQIAWTVQTGARIVSAPQIYRGRVLVQSLDNYLYCLLADNGHEVWRAATSHRLTRKASFWRDRVFVVPETSRTLQIFDLYDGSSVGKWTLPDSESFFRGGPVVLGDLVFMPHARVGSRNCSLAALRLSESEKPARPE